MFQSICLLALISATFAASIGKLESSTEKREIIPLLKYERENNPDGSFKFSFEGGDQTFREETAHVVDAGTEDEALEVTGSYRYIDEYGNTVEVHYTAGRNGFVPVGTHILSEISAAARAAADLPQTYEDELKRKGRSNDNEKTKAEEQNVVKQKSEENQISEQQVTSTKVEEKQAEGTKLKEAEKVHKIPVAVVQVEEEAKMKTA